MANSYNTNPIILNTVMSATAKNTSGVNQTSNFNITKIYWDAPGTTAGHQAQLEDANGNIFYSQTISHAQSNPDPIDFYPHLVLSDYQLTTLGEGTLYVYLQEA
jgi:hypothetical protein